MANKDAGKKGIAAVSTIVTVSSDVGTTCNHCGATIGLDQFEDSVNHYLHDHGYHLLHVGTETTHDAQGRPWHGTVAVLGT